jgi:hypothetical protein
LLPLLEPPLAPALPLLDDEDPPDVEPLDAAPLSEVDAVELSEDAPPPVLDACASINTLNTSLLTCPDELAPDELALASGFALAAVPDDASLALCVADVSVAVALVLSSESSALAVVEELVPETDICCS